MYPYMNHNYGQTFQGPGPRPVAPRSAGGGNPGNAARVAAVMQGRTYTPQKPLPVDAGPSRVRSLADDYQRQINKANRANEQRYQDILGQYNQREQDAMKQANLVRDQRYRDESARIQNDLTSRGLANSSLLGKDLFQSYERNAQYPLAVQLQTSGDKLGFMERRNDVGPDPAMLLQLAAQQGQTDQFQNQNLQQTVGEIGQAVDQRVAQQNAPQPNRLVNLPVMGAPIYGGQMGGYPMPQHGYPQQMYQGPPMQVGAQAQGQAQADPRMVWAEQRRAEEAAKRAARTSGRVAGREALAGLPFWGSGGFGDAPGRGPIEPLTMSYPPLPMKPGSGNPYEGQKMPPGYIDFWWNNPNYSLQPRYF